MRLEESYAFIFEDLFERIMTFQQEVTILSRDTPIKAVISPLLPLNGWANFAERVSAFAMVDITRCSKIMR